MQGFIFGSKDKDKPWTYEELQRKREIADALMAGNLRTPQNVGEGIASIGRALMYRKLDKKAGAEAERLKNEFDAKWGSVFGGYGSGGGGGASYFGGGTPSGTWTPDAPAPDAVDMATAGFDVAKKGGLSFGDKPKADTGVMGAGQEKLGFGAAVMTPQEMLIEGAKARGLDPIDVATAISYETGGKFDPMISGPTTQWGTHRGLIQFGEPQAQQHGVDFSSPDAAWRSQLNPTSGAIWNYLEGAGVRPGMGLDQIYSAINAGSVGRMGASDANNGGAPGTVADKVASMGPHRQKAAQFLGGTWTPNPDAGGGSQGVAFADASGGFPPGMDIGALVGLASDPMASPAQKAIIETLIQQQLQAADPLRALEMRKAQLELAQLENPKPGFEVIPQAEAAAMGLPEGGVYQRGPDGSIETLVEPPKVERPKPYSDIGQIQADLASGIITPEQAQTATEALAKGGTTVNVGAGETQFDKTAGEAAAKTYTAIQDEGISAATGISTLSAMESAMADPNFYSGTGSGMVEGLRRAAVSFGISDPSAVTSMESFNALAKQAALAAMGGSLGAGFSNADRDFVEKQVPTLGNTTEGNREIIRIQKALLTRKQQMADLAAQYAAEREAQGLRFDAAGFQKRAKEFAEANPLFGTAEPRAETAAPAGGVPAGVDPADWEFMTPEERALFQ